MIFDGNNVYDGDELIAVIDPSTGTYRFLVDDVQQREGVSILEIQAKAQEEYDFYEQLRSDCASEEAWDKEAEEEDDVEY